MDKIEFPKSDVLNQKIYQIYVDNFGYPADDENVKLEVGSMYTADILKQCYLDGFLWALPFDVDPYQIAVRIQQDELESKRQLNKTFNNKKEAKTNVAKNNAKQVKNIAKGNNKPLKPAVMSAYKPTSEGYELKADNAGIIKRTWQRIQNFYYINILMKG